MPEAQVRTEAFTLLAICEWFNVINCRSETRSALSVGRVFYTVPFSLTEVVALGAVGSLVLWAEELRKLVARRRPVKPPA